MKKSRNIKKYLTGTRVKGYMDNPAEKLESNRIDIAKAQYESESNPLFMGMDVIGNLAMEYGMSKAVAGVGQEDGKGGTGSKFWDGAIKSGGVKTAMQGLQFFEGGGQVGDVPIEVEDGEVAETPQGELKKFSGKTHEDGGIRTDEQEGTMIYSDALEVDGKSMADRKIAREKRLAQIKKKLEENPADGILKSSFERIMQTNEMEEAGDVQLQEFASAMQGLKEYAMGTSRQGVKKYGNAGEVTDEKEDSFSQNMPWSSGDIFGMAGTAISTIAPYLQTLKNRGADTVNKNFDEFYGEDALKANQQSMDFIGEQQDRALGDAESNRVSSMKRNQNSARGMNTATALNFGTDLGYNESIGKIYDDFSKQTMGLFDKKALLENAQDDKVMSGERLADTENRMQRDNYDTQLSQNIVDGGKGLQKFGSDLNKHKENQDFLGMSSMLSEWGLGWGYEGGKLVLKDIDKDKRNNKKTE